MTTGCHDDGTQSDHVFGKLICDATAHGTKTGMQCWNGMGTQKHTGQTSNAVCRCITCSRVDQFVGRRKTDGICNTTEKKEKGTHTCTHVCNNKIAKILPSCDMRNSFIRDKKHVLYMNALFCESVHINSTHC